MKVTAFSLAHIIKGSFQLLVLNNVSPRVILSVTVTCFKLNPLTKTVAPALFSKSNYTTYRIFPLLPGILRIRIIFLDGKALD